MPTGVGTWQAARGSGVHRSRAATCRCRFPSTAFPITHSNYPLFSQIIMAPTLPKLSRPLSTYLMVPALTPRLNS